MEVLARKKFVKVEDLIKLLNDLKGQNSNLEKLIYIYIAQEFSNSPREVVEKLFNEYPMSRELLFLIMSHCPQEIVREVIYCWPTREVEQVYQNLLFFSDQRACELLSIVIEGLEKRGISCSHDLLRLFNETTQEKFKSLFKIF